MKEEPIMQLYRDTETGDLLIHMENHSINAEWTSGLLYSILAKYLDCIPDSAQNEFLAEVLKLFNMLINRPESALAIHKID
jgi:hypothetical protein